MGERSWKTVSVEGKSELARSKQHRSLVWGRRVEKERRKGKKREENLIVMVSVPSEHPVASFRPNFRHSFVFTEVACKFQLEALLQQREGTLVCGRFWPLFDRI